MFYKFRIKKAVRRGAAFLDDIVPGWYKRINVLKLNQKSSTDCVLAQTMDMNYFKAKEKLNLTEKECRTYGFAHSFEVFEGTADLYWIREIKKRTRADIIRRAP